MDYSGAPFLELASGTKVFDPWPEDLNFQFRPLYLRITRHPLVTALTRAHVAAVEKRPEGYWVSVVHESPLSITTSVPVVGAVWRSVHS